MSADAAPPLPDEVFRSRVDAWLVVMIVAITVVPLVILMTVQPSRADLGAGAAVIIAVAAMALVLLLFAWTYRSTSYLLTDAALIIRCGPLNWHVAYRDITGVAKTSNPMSSAALSLRRLEIRYGERRYVLISPPDRDAFIAALRRRAPDLEVQT
ncbi:MAG TPA: PH domain-containing protein [Gemmatimonadaceae bacterium]|nr:PH domain-containing protein [Gemmatimonadaceae bacterium]